MDQDNHQLLGALTGFYKTVLEMINSGTGLPAVLEALCRFTEKQFPGLLCSILLLDADGKTLHHSAAPSLPEPYNRLVDGLQIGPNAGSCGTAAFRREPVIVTDIATDPLWRGVAEYALPYGLKACWSTPILSRTGSVLGTFAVYYREIRGPHDQHRNIVECATHLAGLAIERERTSADLLAAEIRYRTLVEHLPAITYIAEVGVLGRWLYVSPQIQTILGFSAEEWLANSSNWINHIHPEDRDRALSAETLFWERGGVYRAEYRMIARDNRVLWFRDDATYLRDAEREKPIMQGVLYDITEHKHLEDQLRQSLKMEAIGKLAGGVAHDFNNLLMIIHGHSERILQNVPPTDSSYKDACEIREATGRAASLTRQLLAFSRKQLLQPRILNMSTVVSEVGRMLQRLIGENIELQVVTTSSLWPVQVDQAQIEQAILNLALNARDAMPNGGKLTIEAGNEEIAEAHVGEAGYVRPGKYVVLTVTDNGVGMDSQTQSHIFEPFFTTKELGKGTGLGLASVYGTVKQSGGWISFHSKLGHGSSFRIYLPQAAGGEEPVKLETQALAQIQGSETILVVEDEDEIREITSEYLQQQGYNVLIATNGNDALEIAQRYKGLIHLTVTDVVMPELGGRELAQQLKKLRPRTKILFTSGYPEQDALGENSGLDCVLLQKPYALRTLAGKIRDVLDAPEFRGVEPNGLAARSSAK